MISILLKLYYILVVSIISIKITLDPICIGVNIWTDLGKYEWTG